MSRVSSPARSAGEQELAENDEIEIEQLITLMHRRPPLWDKFDPNYHDRVLKARLWEEIYKQIYFTWDQCGVADRKQKGADVQKKWKNLKDTYFKEVAADKKVVSGQARKKKKRPYIHMGALSFLSTQKSMRDTTNNIGDTERSTINAEDFTNQSEEDTDPEISQNKKLKASMRKKTKHQNNGDDELLKQLLQEKKYDEDVSFCEMLIPMLKNLSTDQKHYAKIEILNALNRATKYSAQNVMPPRVSSAVRQYQSSSSCSSYNLNTPSPSPNTPSPYPNTVRQSPSPQIFQFPPTFAHSPPDPPLQTQYTPSHNTPIIPQSPPGPSPQTQYTPSRNTPIIPQSPPGPSHQTQYTPSRNTPIIPQSPPGPSHQTQYTPSRNTPIIPQSPPGPTPQTQYTPSRNTPIIPQSPPGPSHQTQYTPSRNTPIIPQSPPGPTPQTQYTPSRNTSIIPQSPPDPSPQTQYTPSRNTPIIPQSPPDPSPQTQYTPSRKSVVSQSEPNLSPQDQYTLSLSSDFPNTSFIHSSYVVEGSGFDMKDYILFK